MAILQLSFSITGQLDSIEAELFCCLPGIYEGSNILRPLSITLVHSGHCLCFSDRHYSRYEAIHVHALFTRSRQVWPYLCVGRWQSSPDVDTKEGILPQGDVELQELGLTDVDL